MREFRPIIASCGRLLKKAGGFRWVYRVKKIAEGMIILARSDGRTPLGVALPIAEAFAARLASLKSVRRIEIVGSLRRGKETIGNIDLLCDAPGGKAVIQQFVALEGVKRVLASSATNWSVTVAMERGRDLHIEVRVVQSESFGAALQCFTGSKEHNVRLRELASRRKWQLSEHGLYDAEEPIAGRRERDIYAKLGLPWIPPELREGRDELEVDVKSSELLNSADIRGDLHVHTVASDGRSTIEQIAEAAKGYGYEYIAICDHSKSSVGANGLSIERMKEQIDAIRTANTKVRGIRILIGCEVDILRDGSLDYPDELLAECEWVVASIHSVVGSKRRGKFSPTVRILAAMENQYVSAIGHLTGRLFGQRAPMKIDMEAIVEAAARTETFLELNAACLRLDLKDLHVRQALEAGVSIVLATDAHQVDQLNQMRCGVMTARRGGAARSDVVNTLAQASFLKRIAAKRR